MLAVENKNLRRSLANMALDRDILKETHDIAVKKKVDLAREIIRQGRFKVARVCRVLSVSRSNQYENRRP